MILGLGIDVASIERMERALARHGERMWERILTTEERRELEGRSADRAAALAGRFAAKEALSKALGAPRDVWFHDVEVRRGALGVFIHPITNNDLVDHRDRAMWMGAVRPLDLSVLGTGAGSFDL